MAQARRFDPGPRGYGAGSAVGIVAGLALIAAADPTMTGIGVVAVILGAVGMRLSVAAFLGE